MNQTEIYEAVTARIIEALDAGVVPWRKPWAAAGVPISLATGKAYRGINNVILSLVADLEGYETNLWGTYRQFQEQGAQVQKGQKATAVVLWKPMVKEQEDGTTKSFMFLKTFPVFNLGQTDMEVPEKYRAGEPVIVADGVERVLHYAGGPTVQHREQDQAFYDPKADQITLPMLHQFRSAEAYAGTALHEAVHSTGHESRLARLDGTQRFGCESYAQEELVAEIGASMLGAILGVKQEYEQSAAYVASWLRVLKDDRKMIVHAAQKAQKAVDLILGEQE